MNKIERQEEAMRRMNSDKSDIMLISIGFVVVGFVICAVGVYFGIMSH